MKKLTTFALCLFFLITGFWLGIKYIESKMIFTHMRYLKLAEIEEKEHESLTGTLVNLSKAAAMQPLDPYIYCDIGIVSEKLGDLNYAVRCFRFIIESETIPEKNKQIWIEKVNELEKILQTEQ